MRLFRRRPDSVDYHLGNAEQRHAEAPRSFFIPTAAERRSLQPGDLVKLLFEVVDPRGDLPSAERMWVRVTGVAGERYVGSLDNEPVAITTIGLGSRIDFGPEHVIAIPEDWPLLEQMAFVSRRSHVDDVRPGYVYREEPDDESDSGWRALVGDETQDELDDSANVLLQPVGYLLDRWPDLRPLLEADAEGAWAWDDQSKRYVEATVEP